jgi:hypothetical protein
MEKMKLPEDQSIPDIPEHDDDDNDDNDNDDEDVTSLVTPLFALTITEDEEAAAARSLTHAISTALDDLLEFRHETRPHPVLGEPSRIFLFAYEAGSGNYLIRMEARPSNFLLAYTCPLNIPTHMRAAVAEYICRVNYILLQGCLEMDMQDGEVQYKIVQRNADMTAPVVVEFFLTAVAMMDKFFPGIMAVTYTDKSPEQAFHDCKSAPVPEQDKDDEQEDSTTYKAPTSLEQ